MRVSAKDLESTRLHFGLTHLGARRVRSPARLVGRAFTPPPLPGTPCGHKPPQMNVCKPAGEAEQSAAAATPQNLQIGSKAGNLSLNGGRGRTPRAPPRRARPGEYSEVSSYSTQPALPPEASKPALHRNRQLEQRHANQHQALARGKPRRRKKLHLNSKRMEKVNTR